MNIDFLKKYVTNGIWETEDLRAYKTDLLLMAQQEQKNFKPLNCINFLFDHTISSKSILGVCMC